MTASNAISKACELYSIWIGKATSIEACSPDGLKRIRSSMLQDFRYRRDKPQFAGVVREIRGQFVTLGKVRKALHPQDYTIRKSGDNFALCFRGAVVESGIFATRKTAEKYKRLAEHERLCRLTDAPIPLKAN